MGNRVIGVAAAAAMTLVTVASGCVDGSGAQPGQSPSVARLENGKVVPLPVPRPSDTERRVGAALGAVEDGATKAYEDAAAAASKVKQRVLGALGL